MGKVYANNNIKTMSQMVSNFISKDILDISRKYDDAYRKKDIDGIVKLIEESKETLEGELNLSAKMQVLYDIATGYGELRDLKNTEENLESEILFFRKAIQIYEYPLNELCSDEKGVMDYIAAQCYVNIGNAMRSVGRYISAIDNYFNSANIYEDFGMAYCNLSASLFEYAMMQTRIYETQYYQHAGYYYYIRTIQTAETLHDTKILQDLQNYIKLFHIDYVEGFLEKGLNLPEIFFDSDEEVEYRSYLSIFRLFLDPCEDILPDPCFWVDSLVLPLKPGENKLNDEFIGLFNQLKADFSHARYLWYITTVKDENISSLSEKNNDLIDLKDTADFSYKEMLLRTSYKLFYSCFDKLGLFINEFSEVGLEGNQISFKNVWKNKIYKKSVKNPIKARFDNCALKTLYWIQKDIAEDNETNITDPYAMPMCRMRNDMEHNALRTVKNIVYSEKETIFTNYTSEGSIEHNIFRIMKLLRESLICLTIAVNYDTNKNKNDDLTHFN